MTSPKQDKSAGFSLLTELTSVTSAPGDAEITQAVAEVSNPGEVAKIAHQNSKVKAEALATVRMYPAENREARAAHEGLNKKMRGNYSLNEYLADAIRFFTAYVETHGQLPPNMPDPKREK